MSSHRPPTVAELQDATAFELVGQIEHAGIHRWVRPLIFSWEWIPVLYWALNALAVAAVGLAVKLSAAPIADALPVVCVGMVGGLLLLLPVHEHIHAAAYRAVGARQVRVQYQLRRLTALCIAPGQVVAGNRFLVVCLAPFLVLSVVLVGLLVVSWRLGLPDPIGLWVAGALLLHTGACSGDVALVSYVWRHRAQPFFTFDDAELPRTYFYRPRR